MHRKEASFTRCQRSTCDHTGCAELKDLLRLSFTLFAEVAEGSTRMYEAQTDLIGGFWVCASFCMGGLSLGLHGMHTFHTIESQNIFSG